MNIFIVFMVFLGSELFYAVLGVLLSYIKRFHRLGIRFMSMSLLSSWAVPRFCSCDSDRSCGNWTCPNYHKGS